MTGKPLPGCQPLPPASTAATDKISPHRRKAPWVQRCYWNPCRTTMLSKLCRLCCTKDTPKWKLAPSAQHSWVATSLPPNCLHRATVAIVELGLSNRRLLWCGHTASAARKLIQTAAQTVAFVLSSCS
eukprot:GHUV01001640.1.p1 GENE.GHUV01001640.1~~GHUV01001640.1.p1  ORF type:complete len:128 (-),score=15.82 GHUV01001640.1:454-837(-)